MSVDEAPATAAPEQPAVVDAEMVGDRVLASCEKGGVSVVVEAPAGISEEELEAALDDPTAWVEAYGGGLVWIHPRYR